MVRDDVSRDSVWREAAGAAGMAMLLKHGGIYLTIRVLPGILGFAVLAIYTRLLTPAEYGFYSLVLATETLIVNVAFSWLCSSALRLEPVNRDNPAFLPTIRVAFCVI